MFLVRERLRRIKINGLNGLRSIGKQKFFCVGRNKTGTTSLHKAFEGIGYPVGDQATAERLAHQHYFKGNFDPIIRFCRFGGFFQDVPFSWPATYRYLDEAFPDAKFILTVRQDSETWYRSLVNFHSRLFGKDGRIPTYEDLKTADYQGMQGFMLNSMKIHGTEPSDPYNKDTLIAHYERHNRDVKDYFSTRPGKLLVLDLSERYAAEKFYDFVGVDTTRETLPWENRAPIKR